MKTWRVYFGRNENDMRIFARYYTAYHAEQFAEALRMNGTPYRIEND